MKILEWLVAVFVAVALVAAILFSLPLLAILWVCGTLTERTMRRVRGG
jgi:hypothetical protein